MSSLACVAGGREVDDASKSSWEERSPLLCRLAAELRRAIIGFDGIMLPVKHTIRRLVDRKLAQN